MKYHYRLLNVFAESKFGGNPLCVFENAEGLDDGQMQAIALQFNLSETVFLIRSSIAQAKMRIFTPNMELPFAGHPTLGAAQLVAEGTNGLQEFTLECGAGIVQVRYDTNRWSLVAPISSPCAQLVRSTAESVELIAAMLGIDQADLYSEPVWVNTGNEHLLIPVRSTASVERARIAIDRLALWPASQLGRQNAYIFAFDGEEQSQRRVKARYWSVKSGSLVEDAATGSAAANLGAWWIAQNGAIPSHFVIEQGQEMHRPSRLYLRVDLDANQVPRIEVGGSVIEIGSGVLHL